jgi:hypothetical protein
MTRRLETRFATVPTLSQQVPLATAVGMSKGGNMARLFLCSEGFPGSFSDSKPRVLMEVHEDIVGRLLDYGMPNDSVWMSRDDALSHPRWREPVIEWELGRDQVLDEEAGLLAAWDATPNDQLEALMDGRPSKKEFRDALTR